MHHTIEFIDGSGRCRIRSAEMPAIARGCLHARQHAMSPIPIQAT